MTIKKIIDGLYFTVGMMLFNPATGESKTPDELNEDDRYTYDACIGAIELLKVQEPRVMTLEEYDAWTDLPFTERDPVFHEERTERGTVTCWVNTTVCSLREYGINDRCWTSRPDQATREATPWN